ncbi:ABC transporter ATP-binding protein [Lagierella sp.]|uniref:ABC transporter ATP-binding protein n=1 Tax=Lagierella sp. TaxID=2849657 RepID=UPI0026337BE0|nr:ABC transporter ATP-binding protein [Lagierella sp.]
MKNILIKHKVYWTLTVFLGLLITIVNLGVAYVIGKVIDTISNGTIDDLKMIGIYGAGLLLFMILIGVLYSYFSSKFNEKVLTETKAKIINNIFTSPIYKYQEEKVSYYYNILTQDLEQIDTNYITLTYETLVSLGGLIFSLVALFFISIKMSLIFLLITFLVTLVPRLFIGIQTKVALNFSKEYEGYVEELENLLSGFESIKLLNITKPLCQKIIRKDTSMEASRRKKKLTDGFALYGISGVSFFSQILCMIIGAVFVIRGEITTGMLLASIQILNYVFGPIREISNNRNLMDANKIIRDKLEPYLNENKEIGENLEKGNIVLQDFSISFKEKNIMDNLNLKFEPNKSYAIIGPSGSGKSVLAKSLAGYYENYSGNIFYSGVEGRDVKPSQLHEYIRYIGTNSFILNDNIRENIRMYRDISDSEVEKVAGLVGFDSTFIDKESLGNGGKYISSGEYQRIAIARALLDRPFCLILDEPTANLDPENVKGITKLISNIDVPIKIVITHHYTKDYLDSFDEVIDFNSIK